MLRHVLVATVLAATIILVTDAVAGPVVLYGPGLDSSQAGVIAKQRLKTGDFQVGGSLAEKVGVKGATAVAVGAPYATCSRPAKRPLRGEFLRVDQQMSEMEYSSVRQTIKAIVDKIACYGADASRDDLFTLFFTQGMAAFYDDDKAAAQTAFGQATAIDPSRPWPEQYPPTAKPLYDEALRIMTASPPSRVVSSVPGDVNVDGDKDFGKPRLYPGGHLVFVPGSTTSMWVTIPRAPAMPEDGLLVTTAAELLLGLLGGNDKYGPWLSDLAEKEGWTEIALVSNEDVVIFKEGSFFTTSGGKITRERVTAASMREGNAPAPATIAGIILIGVGAGAGAAGLGLNVNSFSDGLPKVGSTLLPRTDYDRLKTQNSAGLALTVTGAGVAVAGIVVAIVGASTPSKIAALPWMSGDASSFSFGVAGRLP